MKLKDKVAIVTGSSKGIGRGIALALAKEGCKVVVNGTTDTVYDVAKEIEAIGSEALVVKADISDSKEVEAMVKATIEKFGRIDILVNNAGVLPPSLLVEMKEEDWDRTIRVNLRGYFLCAKAVLPKMIEQKYGKIINISSIAGTVIGLPTASHYCTTKGGEVGLTKTLALEVAKYGINVNAIAPGAIRTRMLEGALKELNMSEEQMVKMIPLGRIGEPEDIAKAAVFLASDDSSYITGQTIIVDGGWTTH